MGVGSEAIFGDYGIRSLGLDRFLVKSKKVMYLFNSNTNYPHMYIYVIESSV